LKWFEVYSLWFEPVKNQKPVPKLRNQKPNHCFSSNITSLRDVVGIWFVFSINILSLRDFA